MTSVLVIPLCLLDYVCSGLLLFWKVLRLSGLCVLFPWCLPVSFSRDTPVLGQGWLPTPIPTGPSSWLPVSLITLCCFCKVSKDTMPRVPVNLDLQHSPWLVRITQWVFIGMSE